jgi:hypothetical protein
MGAAALREAAESDGISPNIMQKPESAHKMHNCADVGG